MQRGLLVSVGKVPGPSGADPHSDGEVFIVVLSKKGGTMSETVKEQYSTSDKLSIRISLHSKYSVNKQGLPVGGKMMENKEKKDNPFFVVR